MGKRAKTVKKVSELIEISRVSVDECDEIPLPVRDVLENLFTLTEVLTELIGTSKNSHTPPSQDPDRLNQKKNNSSEKKKSKQGRKPGGQPGRKGTNLAFTDEPDEIVELKIDRRKLPAGNYSVCEPEKRQVHDVKIERVITEYQAERLVDERGNVYMAEFPSTVRSSVQYGTNIRTQGVLLGVEHAMSFERTSSYFTSEYDIPISTGTLSNNEAFVASELEKSFLGEAVELLRRSGVTGFDETGINVSGALHWAHESNNGQIVLFLPSRHRGAKGMQEMDILPHFKGVAVHDFWKSYYSFDCTHALCNAHHLRDLEKIAEDPKQVWAQEMQDLLNEMNSARKKVKRNLNKTKIKKFVERFDQLVLKGLRRNPGSKMKGRRRTKARCLLDRFRDYKEDVLRFLHDKNIPFSNNGVERPIRMLKVEMKVAGYYRSLKTARRSLLIRSYLLTCKNFGIPSSEAMRRVFEGDIPSFSQLIANKEKIAA